MAWTPKFPAIRSMPVLIVIQSGTCFILIQKKYPKKTFRFERAVAILSRTKRPDPFRRPVSKGKRDASFLFLLDSGIPNHAIVVIFHVRA